MKIDPITDAMNRYYRERYNTHPWVFVLGVAALVAYLVAVL